MKKVVLTVNGARRQFVVSPERTLLDLLREDLRLTGAKQSCDRKGQCGACTVIVDKKAVRSCLAKVARLDGAEVITVEGLGTPENPHLIQEAFALAGAIQCGFCTPGMIMAAKALLDANPKPTRDEIKEALKRNLCRCTGYQKIFEAVELAGRFLRKETTPEAVRPDISEGVIGVSMVRPSALLKACGLAQFSADIPVEGVLELAAVRSPHDHARILSIDTSAAEKMPGVVGVMTAKDILGTNRIKCLVADQQVLCDTKAHVLGDPVAVVVAETKAQALAAVEAVKVAYEPLPAALTIDEALAEGALRVHDDSPNLCYTQALAKGDAEKALADSFAVVEATFETQKIHQAALEPEAAVAWWEGEGEDAKLAVAGRSICIHLHLAQLREALGFDNMRYEEAFTGGQFGMKMDLTAETLAAAAALHVKRPVRYVTSLTETMWMTTKRHPFVMKARLGADKNGLLTAFTMDHYVENGAYTSWGRGMITRALQMLSGAYDIPNASAEGKLVYTNSAWGSSARGAGPPQAHFALESCMDMLAKKLGMDPIELRLKNVLKIGGTTSTGQVVTEWPVDGCLKAMKPHFARAKGDAALHKTGVVRRGVGVAAASFGIGKAGPGDKATVSVELDPDGGITLYGSAADPGEGNDTMMAQLGSHLMGVPPEKVRLVTRDTDRTPDSGTASGSRVTYMVGNALASAIETLKAAMKEAGAKTRADLEAAGKPARYTATKTQGTTPLDPKTGQGIPYETRVHGVQMAEIEMNVETGDVKVVKMTAVVDPGTVINPQAVEGQIEGGLDMGVGMALREEYVHGKTKDWVTFRFPTARTAFDIETILLETPRAMGPIGATGVGEFVLLPTNAAVMNAIEDACGVRIVKLPATPERVLSALKAKKD